VLLVLSALIISYICYGMFPHIFKTWDSRIIDHLFVLRPKVNPVLTSHPDIVIHVDANLYSSRPQHAQIIRNLAAMDVSAQLIDFVFTDRISDSRSGSAKFPIRSALVDHADRPGFSFDRPGD
jgi:hypothetical protein